MSLHPQSHPVAKVCITVISFYDAIAGVEHCSSWDLIAVWSLCLPVGGELNRLLALYARGWSKGEWMLGEK